MSYAVIPSLLSAVLSLIVFATMYAVLDIPNRVAYASLSVAFVLFAAYARVFLDPNLFILTIFMPLLSIGATLVFPVVMSRGPLKMRITRIMIVSLGSCIVELLGNTFYNLFGGTPPVVLYNAPQNAAPIALTYCALIPIMAMIESTFVTFFKIQDRGPEADVSLSVIAFLVVSHLCIAASVYRVGIFSRTSTLQTSATVLVKGLLISFACLLLYFVVARDLKHLQRAAAHAAAMRQTKHAHSEVQAITQRALCLQRLRHDLANQKDVVFELIEAGHIARADSYLAALQEQANHVSGEHHER